MKRKLIALLLVASCIVSLLGCSSNKKEETTIPDKEETIEDVSGSDAEPAGITVDDLEAQRSEKELTQEADREKFWNSFEEDIPMKEVDFGSYDIYETTATRMVERIKNKDTFVLFITTAQNKAKDIEKEIFAEIGYEITPDFPIYYVEEEYGYDTYAEEMNTIEPLIPYLTKEDSESGFSLSPYHYGIYEFVDGKLEVFDTNIQIYDPDSMSEEDQENMIKTTKNSMRLIIGNLPSKYNFETVIYRKDELEAYLKNNPNCVLFVGRDSCPYCPAMRRDIINFLNISEWNYPVAYFCSQKYEISEFMYGSSSTEYKNSNTEWTSLKSMFKIDYIPSMIVFNNGESTQIYNNSLVGKSFYDKLVEDKIINCLNSENKDYWEVKDDIENDTN